jgi:hypothetical protein
MNRKRKIFAVAAVAVTLAVTGCSSKRQIDNDRVGSWPVEGTSWRGFCQGANAFIYVPGLNDSDPDELEAVVYDDFRCVKDVNPGTPTPGASSKPDTDPDGIVDDEED